jgi:hypothetical protein
VSQKYDFDEFDEFDDVPVSSLPEEVRFLLDRKKCIYKNARLLRLKSFYFIFFFEWKFDGV